MKIRKHQIIAIIGACAILTACLLGCTAQSEPPESSTEQVNSTSMVKPSANPSESAEETAGPAEPDITNMVDERFELLSLAFRLAGREEYGDLYTDYQQSLVTEFGSFSEHAAVRYAAALPLGFDAVFNFSVHLTKEGEHFALIDDIGSLVEDGRWTRESAAEFLPLLNDFYVETKFAEFYQSNMDFYINETKRFVEDTYSEIDLEWFRAYVDPDNLRSVYSPSSTRNNYGATVNDTIIYSSVSDDGSAVVHEFCHSFANPISRKWYEENPEFRQWCDDTIDAEILPNYESGETIAGEYVTRAYNTLYYAEHGYAPISLLFREELQGFPYIADAYAMITDYEQPDMSDIESILGVRYEMGEEQSVSVGDRVIRWRVLTLADPLPLKYLPTEVGNVFGSETGDVLYIEDTGDGNPFLYIDLGEATFQGEEGYRSYTRIPMEP